MIGGDQLGDVAFGEGELVPELSLVIRGEAGKRPFRVQQHRCTNCRGSSFGCVPLLAGQRAKKRLALLPYFVRGDGGELAHREVLLSRAKQLDGLTVRAGWTLR